jgi:hypothetical protein
MKLARGGIILFLLVIVLWSRARAKATVSAADSLALFYSGRA